MRNLTTAVAVLALLGGLGALPVTEITRPSPVASDPVTYELYGRVFPDPQGCLPDGPGVSPWRKGNACTAGFLSWDDALAGLAFLEQRFDRYVDVVNLREDVRGWPELDGLDLQSAGIVRSDLERERFDLYAIHVTDDKSPVPEAERAHFGMMLGLHGPERSGAEGGLRAIEDLVGWAACEDDVEAAPACAIDGPFPKPILEPSSSGPRAGDVLRQSNILFLLGNPDGWIRGDQTRGGTIFNRANGNGTDLNRDWPVPGYVEPIHTPWSEPESLGFGRYLEALRDRTATGRFEGLVDFHGIVSAHALSLTLLPVDEDDYASSRRLVDVAELTFADAEERITWSPHVAPHDECPGPVPDPFSGRSFVPMCTDQWGTVWDTIGYNVTGAMASWAGSPLGLGASTLGNEMAQFIGGAISPDVMQLQVDGTKGLLYTELTGLLDGYEAAFKSQGRIAYLADPIRTRHTGVSEPERPFPPQDGLVIPDLDGTGVVEFDVHGADDDVSNGGMRVDLRYVNAHGTIIQDHLVPVIQRCPPDGTCEDVAVYVPLGATEQGHPSVEMAVNDPERGRYRVTHRWHPNTPAFGDEEAVPALPAEYHVTFTAEKAYPEPEQLEYDVSRLDFFVDLNQHVDGRTLEAVPFERVATAPGFLNRFDTLVVADRSWPGAASDEVKASYADNLQRWVERGGTLVLTDGALALLRDVADIDHDAVTEAFFSTGWIDFDDGGGPTYDRHPLAAGIDRDGAAEGRVAVDDGLFDNARETYTSPPLGFYVSPNRRGNAICDTDRCDAPIWIVDQTAWEAAGGTTAARTFVRLAEEPEADGVPAAGRVGVSLGELGVGDGRIRIAGALLPEPTEANHHPYGLSSYAVTPTGYQLLENLLATP